VYCLDAATGRKVWHYPGLHVDVNLAVAGDRVYGGSCSGDVHKDYAVFCLDAATGDVVWRKATDLPVPGSPLVSGGHVYFGLGTGNFSLSDDRPAGAVVCAEAATGETVWRHDVGDGVLGRPAADRRYVYFGSRDGSCYCVGRRDGRLRWKRPLGSPVVAAPVLAGDSLYVAASDGPLYGLEPASGRVLWAFDVAGHFQKQPQLYATPGADGRRIYLAAGLYNGVSWAATLHCLEEREE
jgi:outer membrane protein assembly factor BamB